ncbi:TIGR03087 family PEP-CTERM/XrtA system glycosyltransferase [Marinobacter salinisoli]|uniref:TIGR03087 family PEP-CTERM/XrtA system glycosyltransferase n=1 Tax=Marinobacter salinisoli TaxID=2769486 RepID=A0ABX7MN01_9GAMM|nr:TIGR03087 family PEP-CTERM/XrtA system glycosyltransferase [Marinobacter salinisoli]QSP93518.1 TIGR03087 family PEP-CTERM/XrtA system glycosyltransferase [Marinobacter salinisoli]
MKIIILSHRVPFPPNKGEKIRTFHQIQYLASRGHNVVVLSPYECAEELEHAAALEKKLPIEVQMFPLESKWFRLARGFTTNQALTASCFYSRKLQEAFDELIGSGSFDAVLCTGSAMAPYVFRNPELQQSGPQSRPRLLMDFMDLDSDKWKQYQASSAPPMSVIYGREAKLVSEIEKQSYEVFDECFFVSANEIDLFSAQLPESSRLRVLGNGIDTDLFFPRRRADRPNKPVFLFTGVMNYKPNEDAVQWFVDSIWDDIKAEWPDAQFVVAGMDPSPKIKELGKKPGIVVTGFVEDIVPYYQQADVFVSPFRFARGVQNKILQALACGLPVITTQLGLEGINAKPGEEVLVANTDEEFSEAIRLLLQDEELSKRFSERSPKYIERNHSWERILADLAAALETRDFV